MSNNPRIHIALDQKIITMLNRMAKQENKSLSALTKDLILEALKLREDAALAAAPKKE